MRKLVIAAGLLMAAALVPGAPAQAAVGCQCVRLGAPSACLPNVSACNRQMGGLCVAPCSYSPQKAVKRHAVKRKMVRAGSQHPAKKKTVAKKTIAKKPAPKKKPKQM
jgi:hypothetical protein